jgi:hypothetical protein
MLRHQLEAQAHELLRQLEPDDKRYLEIPPEYGAAWPLDLEECTTRSIAGSFGYPSIMYKVIDRRSGAPYALRRVDGARISPKAASATQIRWRSVQHANLISLRRAFVHSGATYFLHEYCPCAKTLLECHFPPHLDCMSANHPLVRHALIPNRPDFSPRINLMELFTAARLSFARSTCNSWSEPHPILTCCTSPLPIVGMPYAWPIAHTCYWR